MDVRSLIRKRLDELGLEQKDLAAAAKVTESYVSQLLTRRKLPPAPERTDIYGRMEKALRLPSGQLSELAELERRESMQKQFAGPLAPLLPELRRLVLAKCAPSREPELRAIFEREPLGELERLVTEKLLDVVKRAVRADLENESWLRLVARLSGSSYEVLRVRALEFLDTDVFNTSADDCATFLDPLLETWEIDVPTFATEVRLNPRLVTDPVRRFEFVERDGVRGAAEPPGLSEFLRDSALSADATPEELALLRGLRFPDRQPTALYYYRELQSLRDPLHFRGAPKRTRASALPLRPAFR
jgi:transcriptional regulator with XRE-family HTH domain